MSGILELKKVSKRFPTHHAVKEVSLELARGEFFSLLGPSGCGKTTTLRMIAGFETPTEGEVWLNGSRIDELPPYRRNVNTVFQSYALFPHLTVRGNVEFGLRRKNESDIDSRVAKVLEQVRLEGKESRMPSELSGGERQRVALARSLVLAPDVLLLDEPLSALDPQLRKQVRAELKDLQRRSGVAFLFVTHDQEEALSMSDRIAVMNRGEVEQCGTPQEIYQRPRTKFVANFLGAMNWIDGIGVRPECTRLSVTEPRSSVTEPRHSLAEPRHSLAEPRHSLAEPRHSLAEPRHSLAEPRPSGSGPVPVSEETGPLPNGRGSVTDRIGSRPDVRGARPGIVTRSVFLGSAIHVEAKLATGELVIAQVAPNEIFSEGDPVQISWQPQDELRFD